MPPTLWCDDLERMTLDPQPEVFVGTTGIACSSVELELNHRHPTMPKAIGLQMYLIDVAVEQVVVSDKIGESSVCKYVYTLAQYGSRDLAENMYKTIAARFHAGDAVRITGSNTAVLFRPVK